MPDEATAIVRDLISAGVDAALIARVSVLAARLVELDRRRAADANRQKRKRVNDSHVTSRESRDTADVTPVHILSPKKIEPKKVLSMQIDPKIQISETGVAFASDLGWSTEHTKSEFDRFRDHFIASGARKKDWEATWRNWVRSPYQKSNGSGPRNSAII